MKKDSNALVIKQIKALQTLIDSGKSPPAGKGTEPCRRIHLHGKWKANDYLHFQQTSSSGM